MPATKSSTPFKNYYFIIPIILLLGIGLFYISSNKQQSTPANTNTPSPTLSPQGVLLADIAVWYPSAPWTEPKSDSQTTTYGDLTGESMQATVTSPNPSLDHFEMVETLQEKGFLPDNTLSADGPGSSVWGYKKVEGNNLQVITFSYKTQPTNTNPNEPIQFNCPCKIDITVFVSNPTPVK